MTEYERRQDRKGKKKQKEKSKYVLRKGLKVKKITKYETRKD